MTEPDPRFEVPPDYAQVYETTYRRASTSDDELEPLDRPVEPGSVGRVRSGRRGLPARSALIAAAIVALVLVSLVSFGLGRIGRDDMVATAPGGPAARLSSGAPRLLAVHPQLAVSSCPAPSISGGHGSTVRLGASKALDDDAATSWACEGLGEGQAITMTLPAGSTLSRIEIVPASSVSGVRSDRIDSVEWSLNGSPPIVQGIDADTSRPQGVNLDPVEVTTVVLTLTAVTPGPADLAAISSIRLWGPPAE